MKTRYLTFLFALLCCAPFARGQANQYAPGFTLPSTATFAQQGDNVPNLLARIAANTALSGGGSGGGSGTPGSAGTTVTPTITSATTGGTVSAGSRSLTFVFSANFTGTVLGVAYSGTTDAAQPLVPPAGCTLSQVSYTVTAGSVRIVDIR